MARYIDADKLWKDLDTAHLFDDGDSRHIAQGMVEVQPTADVVEVVRCKDCTEWDEKIGECSHWYGFRETDFCSYGERKE